MDVTKRTSNLSSPILDRYSGPKTLINNGIPCAIWAEDALKYYGVPTMRFDLFCLVENTQSASECLQSQGFTLMCENSRPRYQFMPELIRGRPRLSTCPNLVDDNGGENPTIVLLPASSWTYAPANLSLDLCMLYPTLPLLLEGLIDGWIDAEDAFFSGHIGVHIAYLYAYVPQIREPSFGDSLREAYHKDFHKVHLEKNIWESEKQYFRNKKAMSSSGI